MKHRSKKCPTCEKIKKLFENYEVDDPYTGDYLMVYKIAEILGIKLKEKPKVLNPQDE